MKKELEELNEKREKARRNENIAIVAALILTAIGYFYSGEDADILGLVLVGFFWYWIFKGILHFF